jgi:ATP adenylyltransferase
MFNVTDDSMEHLFAPWRMEYIGSKQPEGCLFCRVLAAPPSEDEANLVVWRPQGGVVLLNRFPYNNGHLMVAPAAHVPSLTDLDDEQSLQLMWALRRSLTVLERELAPEGFNVGVNLGKVAGAGIPDHVHVHVVPRWNGDTNFMPVLGETKVINQHLASSWAELSGAFGS